MLISYLDFIAIGIYYIVLGLATVTGFFISFPEPGLLISIPLLFFISGYVLMIVFFQNAEFSGLESIGLSIILSLCILVLMTLVMNWAGISINPTSFLIMLLSVNGLILILGIFFRTRNPRSLINNPVQNIYKVVIFVLVGVIVLTFIYDSWASKPQEHITELSILSVNDDTSLPFFTKDQGDPYKFKVMVTNYEGNNENYSLQFEYDDNSETINLPLLGNGDSWSQEYDIKLDQTKDLHRLNLVLFKFGSNDPYRTVHLWVDSAK